GFATRSLVSCTFQRATHSVPLRFTMFRRHMLRHGGTRHSALIREAATLRWLVRSRWCISMMLARLLRTAMASQDSSTSSIVGGSHDCFCADAQGRGIDRHHQHIPPRGPPVHRQADRTSRPLQPIRKDLMIRFRRQRLAREAIMAAKEISVKKYVVRLSGEERERLETLIRKGKSPARRVLKARILLKADVS